MEKHHRNTIGPYTYDESGMEEVTKQVLDSYSYGFIDMEGKEIIKEE